MEFKRIVTEEDYIRSVEFNYLNSREGKKSLLNYRLRIPILSASLILLIYVVSDNRFVFSYLAAFLVIYSIVWIFVAKYLALHQIRKNIKKQIKKGEISCPMESTLTFGDTSFTSVTPAITSTYEYSSVDTVCLTSTDIYIHLTSTQIIVIIMPFTMFSSVDEINSFIGFLSAKVDPSKFKHK